MVNLEGVEPFICALRGRRPIQLDDKFILKLAGIAGIKPAPPDRQSGILIDRPYPHGVAELANLDHGLNRHSSKRLFSCTKSNTRLSKAYPMPAGIK